MRNYYTVLALFGILLLSESAYAGSISLRVVVKSGDIIDGVTVTNVGDPQGYSNTPSLNRHGQVVFVSDFVGGRGVFTLDSLVARDGDIIGGETLLNVWGPASVNDSGEVVFGGSFAGGQGVFTPDSVLVRNDDVIDGETLCCAIGAADLNNSDTVLISGQAVVGY